MMAGGMQLHISHVRNGHLVKPTIPDSNFRNLEALQKDHHAGKGPCRRQKAGSECHFRNVPMDRVFRDVLFCYLEGWYTEWRIFSETKNG